MLMPILWNEPFGIVMAEAMACGTPVIGFRRGAVPEVVAHGETGFVVDTTDEMIAAIDRIAEIARAACRARVETLYSDATIAEAYLAIYARMTERLRNRVGCDADAQRMGSVKDKSLRPDEGRS